MLFGLLGLGMVLFTTALMMSDRAPRVLGRLFGDFVRRLSDRIDAGGRPRLVTDTYLVEGDQLVHIGLWAVVIFFVATAVWTWRGLVIAAIGVFLYSAIVEVGQGPFSTTRSVELSDAKANGVGIIVGSAVVALAFVAWDLLASRWARRT